MLQQQQIAIIDKINGSNLPSFQYVGLNNMGRRTFLAHVPILLLPHLWVVLDHPDDDADDDKVHTNNSTRMSILFCHLLDNMADMLEMRTIKSTATATLTNDDNEDFWLC
jgi:hypothetical protein